MTWFDIAALGIVALSVVFAYARGVIRSLIGTAAWVIGFVVALGFAPLLGAQLPAMKEAPAVPYVIAFVLVFVLAIVIGALVAWPLRAIVRKAGMGFLDAALGASFGFVRGIAIMIAFALIAGATGMAQRDWWQNAFLAPSLASASLALRPWLPQAWSERLDFSPPMTPPRSALRAPPPEGADDLGAALRSSMTSPPSALRAPPPEGADDLGAALRSSMTSLRVARSLAAPGG